MKQFYFSFSIILIALLASVSHASNPPGSILLEGQPNFRDIGGYQTTDGRTVKKGLVYRSGELPRLTDQDVQILNEGALRP